VAPPSASKIFAVFAVLLGVGVLSVVTASIAAMRIEIEERRIEREILNDRDRQPRAVHAEIAALRKTVEAWDAGSQREPL
jgi:voltage-gated potassium channel